MKAQALASKRGIAFLAAEIESCLPIHKRRSMSVPGFVMKKHEPPAEIAILRRSLRAAGCLATKAAYSEAEPLKRGIIASRTVTCGNIVEPDVIRRQQVQSANTTAKIQDVHPRGSESSKRCWFLRTIASELECNLMWCCGGVSCCWRW